MRDEGFGLKGDKSHFGFILPVEILRELDLQLVLHTPYDLIQPNTNQEKCPWVSIIVGSLIKSIYMGNSHFGLRM